MSRVLTATMASTGPRRLASVSPDRLDPVVRELVDRASAEAYERGVRDGRSQGASEAERHAAARADQLAAAVDAAADAAARDVRNACDEVVDAVVDLAVAIATTILDHEPSDGGAAVAGRLRDALALVEDPRPVVHVAAADEDFVSAALRDLHAVTVAVDPTLAPGEARIRGGWAEGDLTRAAAFDAIRRELGVRS